MTVLEVVIPSESHSLPMENVMSSLRYDSSSDDTDEKDDGTHKPREGGGELVSKTNQTLKTRVKRKNFFCSDRITKFDKSILNQSSFTQKPLLKFFIPKGYFL